MEHIEVIIVSLLVSVAVLSAAARVNIPYPIVLVIGGARARRRSRAPGRALDPDLVLVVFLPPLLYSAAFFANLRDLRRDLRPISLLSIGLVLATMWSSRSSRTSSSTACRGRRRSRSARSSAPTDPVAATAIARRLGVPRRIVTRSSRARA